ncbi:hypothetical protein AAFX33_17660 [Vibrio chagasii]|uniref:hypothetical protein n=1 Tax=Vibrio chagasii TaxID=170679 RepID=UPI0038CD3B0A
MKNITPLVMLLISASAASETYIFSLNTKHGLPTLTEEPNLYQAPSFDFFDFSEGYLAHRAEASALLPIALNSIDRVCISTTFSEIDREERYPQSGVLVYTYVTNAQGKKTHNTTIGDRTPLAEVSQHCLDESSWVYDNWLADKRIDFTPYSSAFALIENVDVVVEGDLSLSQDPVEFVEQYFDFITKVGFNQSASFYHTDAIRELKSIIMEGLQNGNQNVLDIVNIAFGSGAAREDIAVMDDKVFMNTFLNIRKIAQGSNIAKLSSFSVINDFDYQGQKYITVEKKEQFGDRIITQYEIIKLKSEGEYWMLNMSGDIKALLGM